MGLKTPLYDLHVQQGAKIVDFGGWDMPLHYGSQIEEHHCGAPRRRHVRRLAHGRRRSDAARGFANSCDASSPTMWRA